jgi:hypothetical protein
MITDLAYNSEQKCFAIKTDADLSDDVSKSRDQIHASAEVYIDLTNEDNTDEVKEVSMLFSYNTSPCLLVLKKICNQRFPASEANQMFLCQLDIIFWNISVIFKFIRTPYLMFY